MMIGKTFLVLIIELGIYYILGTMLASFFWKEQRMRIPMRLISGFLLYQILFQICALPLIILKEKFTLLVTVWLAVISVVLLMSVIRVRKVIFEDAKEVLDLLKGHKLLSVGMVILFVFLGFFVYVKGNFDDDSIYYIGLVNTTLTSDIMFRINVYTGELAPSLYLRRILSTFEINTAMQCKVFGVHPIVMMRGFRGWLNVVLTGSAIYLLGTQIYKKRRDVYKKSCYLVCVTYLMYFLFENTIYTNAEFFLHRAYEGKSYAGNVLIYYVIYLCVAYFLSRDRRYLVYLFLCAWSATAISSSAIAVCVAGIGLFFGAYILNIGLNRWKNSRKKVENVG